MTGTPLLAVQDLRLELNAPKGRTVGAAAAAGGALLPVDGVSFALHPGECVALVGESGSGKSLTAMTLLGLARQLPGARITGSAQFSRRDHGASADAAAASVDLVKAGESALQHIRGRQIGMVFQDPLSCLNPLMKVGTQIGEVLQRHTALRGRAARARIVELLEMVGVPQPATRAVQYPHQLSGGLRQRVLLAVALAAGPQLLIADEPTTALDVTIQAQILDTLRTLQRDTGMAVLFITHDLGVVAQLCSRVMVMYAGRIVEHAPVAQFFDAPCHPYSQGLLSSLPGRAAALIGDGQRPALTPIPGNPPRLGHFPAGCRFNPRCRFRVERCTVEYPPFMGPGSCNAACWEQERAAADWQARRAAGVGV